MKRSVLDQVAQDYHLAEPAVAAALEFTGARPDAAAWHGFTLRLLNAAGIGALGAGLIFFVAANWRDYGTLGRFAILEAAFIACVGFALWRPPPGTLGQSALVLATLVTGALLALFGQSYQTGADLYELFFVWAALALPFALAGRSGAVWATWWTVLNVALALYCGLQDADHFMWLWLDRWGIDRPMLLLMSGFVDLAGAAAVVYLARTRFAEHAPHWLARTLATYGFLFATLACIVAIAQNGVFVARVPATTRHGLDVVAIFTVACALIGTATVQRRIDVYPLALIAASAIAVSTTLLVHNIKLNDLGDFFVISIWLIATSTAAGFMLMRWVRAWRTHAGANA
ncbi:MAG TPA: DUF2157 domain-containing protein [Usitatibacter sp.]